ncbi:hypothetical protein [Streptomyces sp.]|uniref:hypothetical protein n=1 Tax=Streptomyces sp. TaxID=1931 RepID=UPI002F3E47B1
MVAAVSTGVRAMAVRREWRRRDRTGSRAHTVSVAGSPTTVVTRTTTPARTTAAAFLCAAAALTGCGGQAAGTAADSRGGAEARTVSTAADTLVRAGTSRVTTSMRMASGGTWLTITGSGGFDYARRRGRLTLVLPPDATGAAVHKPITELLTPDALYMKDRGEGVPPGKWVRVDTTRLPDGNLVTGGATEPLAAAELLRGAEHVTLLGPETLADGTRTRHYRGVADIARAAHAMQPAARGPLEAAARGFTVTRVPFDAWLDGQGRLRQVSQRFTFSSGGTAKGAGRNVTVVSTTRFDGFGAPVPVTLPRPADIWTGEIVSAQP